MASRNSDTQPIPEVAARYAETTYKVIGAAMKVHNQLGPGLREVMYQRGLSAALREAEISFEEEKPFEVTLEDQRVGIVYLDHFVEGEIVVEEKAFPHQLTNDEIAQMLTYLSVADAPLGLLINFGRRRLEYPGFCHRRRFRTGAPEQRGICGSPPGHARVTEAIRLSALHPPACRPR